MAIKLVTKPTEEPVTVDMALHHLRQLDTNEQQYVELLIPSARQYVENILNRALVTQTWDFYLDAFPAGDYIDIPRPPLQSITTLKYKDSEGTLQTFAAASYIVDIYREPGRVSLAYGQSWPATYPEAQAVQIRFVCGYGTADDVSNIHKLAILLKLGSLYDHRGDEAVDENVENAIRNLLADRIIPV